MNEMKVNTTVEPLGWTQLGSDIDGEAADGPIRLVSLPGLRW
jgi:hypothetical protein